MYHYILQNPRIRLLLSDEPGAGTTIMAVLLIKELKYRSLIERILIVVPDHLKDQWRREMKEIFGENFLAVNSDVIIAQRGLNAFKD